MRVSAQYKRSFNFEKRMGISSLRAVEFGAVCIPGVFSHVVTINWTMEWKLITTDQASNNSRLEVPPLKWNMPSLDKARPNSLIAMIFLFDFGNNQYIILLIFCFLFSFIPCPSNDNTFQSFNSYYVLPIKPQPTLCNIPTNSTSIILRLYCTKQLEPPYRSFEFIGFEGGPLNSVTPFYFVEVNFNIIDSTTAVWPVVFGISYRHDNTD